MRFGLAGRWSHSAKGFSAAACMSELGSSLCLKSRQVSGLVCAHKMTGQHCYKLYGDVLAAWNDSSCSGREETIGVDGLLDTGFCTDLRKAMLR